MQPGSNYRVVASVIDETMYAGVQVSNSAAAKYLGPELNQNGGAPATPLLTVWRKLWVENDSMEAIPTDTFGYKRNDLSHDLNSPTILTKLSDGTNTSFGIPGITDQSSFLDLENNGRMIVQSAEHPVIATTLFENTHFVQIPGDLSNVPLGSGFRLYDDDDFGLDAAPLPRQNLVNDQMKNYFKPSFVEVSDASAFNPRKTVPLHLNEDVSTNLYGQSSTVVDDARDLTDKNECWVCPLTAAYQGPFNVDNDPDDGENTRFGETATYGENDHSTVFVEGCRENYDALLRSHNPESVAIAIESTNEWIVAALAHEMGHQPGHQSELEDHNEGALMTAGMADVSAFQSEEAKFSPATMLRFRKSKRWSE